MTFDSPQVISLSGYSFIDENGAHPNAAFDAVVWDKTANRAVALRNCSPRIRRRPH